MASTKQCRECKESKLAEEFNRSLRHKDGRDTRCRVCHCADKAVYREANRAAINEGYARRRRENPEKTRENDRRKYRHNPAVAVARTKRYREKYPDKRHANHIKFKYGLEWPEYAALLERQGGGCALCGATSERHPKKKRLIVDHDHITGKVRGLLCDKHNRAIGLFGDDPDMLIKAVLYLVESQRIWVQLAA